MNLILEIDNLTYKDILKNLSCKIEDKTFNVLLGLNGSGKTTLVKCLAGLLKYEGQIKFFGEVANEKNIQTIRKQIGFLSSFNTLFDGTALYNITYPLLNLGYSEFEAKKTAYSISKKLDIENLLLKNINDLKLGEKKLISLATILSYNPELVIIDDSLESLSEAKREKVLKYLKSKKITIIYITNKITDLETIDKFLFLNNKEIIERSLEELLQEEKDLFKGSSNIPFVLDLSNKLKAYEVIKRTFANEDELIEELWK